MQLDFRVFTQVIIIPVEQESTSIPASVNIFSIYSFIQVHCLFLVRIYAVGLLCMQFLSIHNFGSFLLFGWYYLQKMSQMPSFGFVLFRALGKLEQIFFNT